MQPAIDATDYPSQLLESRLARGAPRCAAGHDPDRGDRGVDEIGGGGVKRWLVNPALAWPNSLDPIPRMTIPPGATRYVDLGAWPTHILPLRLTVGVARRRTATGIFSRLVATASR